MSLLHILSISKEFAYKKEERYNINGVRIELASNNIKAIATNVYMLSVFECSDFENTNNIPSGKYTISLKSIKVIEKVLKADKNADISKYIEKIQADFVEYEKVLTPRQDSAENRISSFNPDYLQIIGNTCSVFNKHFQNQNKDNAMFFEYNGINKPAKFSINGKNCKFHGLVMPMKS
jgi:hypothetical protein